MPEARHLPSGGRGTAGVCDDDHQLRDVLRRTLQHEGFAVRLTASGTEAIRAFAAEPPQVIVLDIGLPDADGREVCQVLRGRGVAAPVLFLTGRTDLADRLAAFDSGGDDYLAKPFELEELVVRIRALTRRSAVGRVAAPGPAGDVELELDLSAYGAAHHGRQIPLTPTEFRLLGALLAARGRAVSRAELIAAGWPPGAQVSPNMLDSALARLRSRLRRAGVPPALRTVRGQGYAID